MRHIPLSTAVVAMLTTLIVTAATSAVVRASETDELRERANAMRKESTELAGQGRKAEAEKLECGAAKLAGQADRMAKKERASGAAERPERTKGEKRRKPAPESAAREVKQLQGRLERLRQQAQRLAESGAAEEERREVRRMTEATEKEVRVLQDRLGRLETKGNKGRVEQSARRIEHVRNASKHLREAGMGDVAEELSRNADRMEKDLRHAAGRPEGAANTHRADVAEERRGRAQVEDLRREVERLRKELNEVRQQVQRG